jgi:starch synthase (maltosyl-transferring)
VIGRIPVLDVSPSVGAGRWPGRSVVGETFAVSATVFREGHDLVGGTVVLTPPGATARQARRTRMSALPDGQGARLTDGFTADVTCDSEGLWKLVVEGWADPWATWRHAIEAKLEAGQQAGELANDLETGALLLERAAKASGKQIGADLRATAKALRDETIALPERVTAALGVHALPLRDLVTPSAPLYVRVDRERALFSSWYEFFPRSEGGFAGGAIEHLDYVASLGADVVYLPPVHPIGRAHRKGPNNTLTAGPKDPGSPWAIGSADGGHDALAPELGTMADFDAFVARAGALGMEVALDLALQCSPDHPWVAAHPEFFQHRPDGSIAYAENPPKKYQDIYPLDFDSGGEALRQEILRVFLFWIGHGIKIFRVDNPHTKPVAFWEWLIESVKKDHPDVLFLAEAFTRPPMVHSLAMVGFTQSYTYFTWRNAAWELIAYLQELTSAPSADYLRPNLFVNTPDILHGYLQTGGAAAFKIRAAVAATASPSWGVYSGYEWIENTAVRAGSEEYLDSEKYQIRTRDWDDPPLAPYLRRLNQIRREHLALQRLRGLVFHPTLSADIIAFSRRVWTADGTPDTILTIVNLDPFAAHEATVQLDVAALGLRSGERFLVHDQLGTRGSYEWTAQAYVHLDPSEPAHVMHVTRLDGTPA